ncbi:MAG: BadF/BadG/BcrA/BcrD ATPase family protein [Anaerolineaceae bacterium]
MTQYFLGIDVGGSKTHALVADEEGRACGFGKAGPGNHEGVGYDGLSAAMQAATRQALAQAGIAPLQIAGAGFGLGGYDWVSELSPTLEAIRPLGIDNAAVEVVNDAMIGLVAGAQEGWGLAVVAGSGCNCWGRNRQHRYGNVTGMGFPMGEGAGAGELVGEAVRRVSRAWSRRGPATRLTEVFCELVGVKTASELIEGLTQERFEIRGRAAPLIFKTAENGDAVACDVIRWAGESLADLAAGVARQLEIEQEQFEVVLVGSLFNGGNLLIEPMRAALLKAAPGATLVRLTTPPVIGGVLLGMEQCALPATRLRQQLIQTTQALLTAETPLSQ